MKRPGFYSPILLALIACSTTAPNPNGGLSALRQNEGLLFLTTNVAPTDVMTALFVGQVNADAQGCLRLDLDGGQTVVWPHGATLDANLRVHDGQGRLIGRIGGGFRFGGGEVPLHDGLPLTKEQIEAVGSRCPGKLWIVGDVQ